MKMRFFRHAVGGFAVGLFTGAVVLCLMIWVVLPDARHIPVVLAAIALFEAGLVGAIAGSVLFLRRISGDDSDEDDDDTGPPGGTRVPDGPAKAPRLAPAHGAPVPA